MQLSGIRESFAEYILITGTMKHKLEYKPFQRYFYYGFRY